MDRKCKHCGENIANAENLILCPYCKNSPDKEPEPQFNSEQVKIITKQVKKDLLKTLLFWLTILSLIFGIGFWQAYKAGIEKMEKLLIVRISEEFKEPRIKETVQSVAQNQAAELLRKEIRPKQEKITSQIDDFRSYLNQVQHEFTEKSSELSTEIEFLKKRNKLLRLSDKAITKPNSSVSALKKLYSFTDIDVEPSMREMATSEILRVKLFYITTSRIKNFNIEAADRAGPIRTNDEISTDILISKLRNASNWKAQAKAAKLLSNRREKNVPQALLISVCENKVLDVVKIALDSFEAVTGFKSNDVFDCEDAKRWWNENKQQVMSRLK